MTSNREIAQEIIRCVRENKDITKNRLIQEVCKKKEIGSTAVRDVLSKLYVLKIVGYKTIQRAQVHFVNEKNLDKLEKIED